MSARTPTGGPGTLLSERLYLELRTRILDGDLHPGERLPPTRVLAASRGVARATVAEAYDQLRVEGYLQTRRGAGTFVASTIRGHEVQREVGFAPRLSAWGLRVSALAAGRPAPTSMSFCYDLRPHRIATDLFPWESWTASVAAGLREQRASLIDVPDAAGMPMLRSAIVEHVRRYRAVRCSPSQIVVVNGAQQALNLLAEATLDPGDTVVVEDPGYPPARRALEARGLDVRRVPVDSSGLIVDRLPADAPVRLAYITPSHQDPTGVTMSLSRRLLLLDAARRSGAIVVEDDYDSEFRFEGRPVESLQALDRGGQVAYIGSFSKSILPGLRLGFLVAPPALAPVLREARALWDGGAPLLDQAALAHFLDTGEYEKHIRRMRRVYRARRDALARALQDNLGERIRIEDRSGGLNLLIHLDLPTSANQFGRRLEGMGVRVSLVDDYYACPPDRPQLLLGFGGLPVERARDVGRLFSIAAAAES